MSDVTKGGECLLGRGKVYLDALDSDGERTGEFYLGDCSIFEIEATADEITHRSSSDRLGAVIASAVINAALSLKITGHQYSKENLARAFGGTTSTLTQTTDDVEDEAIADVKQGYYFALAYRSVTAVVVTGTGGTPTYDLDDDYTVDAVTGRIYIVEGGAITDDTDIEVSYTYATIALPTVGGMTTGSVRAFVRYVGDPPAGPLWEVQCWRVNLRSQGAVGFTADDFGAWSLQGTIEADSVNHPDNPNYNMILLGEAV
jgi:hypothetical protein